MYYPYHYHCPESPGQLRVGPGVGPQKVKPRGLGSRMKPLSSRDKTARIDVTKVNVCDFLPQCQDRRMKLV